MSESSNAFSSKTTEYTIRVDNSEGRIVDDAGIIDVPLVTLPGDIPLQVHVQYDASRHILTIIPKYTGLEPKRVPQGSGDVDAIIGKETGRVYNLRVKNYKRGSIITKDWIEIQEKFKAYMNGGTPRVGNNLALFTRILSPSVSRFRTTIAH